MSCQYGPLHLHHEHCGQLKRFQDTGVKKGQYSELPYTFGHQNGDAARAVRAQLPLRCSVKLPFHYMHLKRSFNGLHDIVQTFWPLGSLLRECACAGKRQLPVSCA